MIDYKKKLDELLSFTDKNIDSFQISNKIENIVFKIVEDIFSPYMIETIMDDNLNYTPDLYIKYTPLGKIKNRIFFEIKSRNLAKYDIITINNIIQELISIYRNKFYTLIYVTTSLDMEIIKHFNNENVKFVTIYQLLELLKLSNLYI